MDNLRAVLYNNKSKSTQFCSKTEISTCQKSSNFVVLTWFVSTINFSDWSSLNFLFPMLQVGNDFRCAWFTVLHITSAIDKNQQILVWIHKAKYSFSLHEKTIMKKKKSMKFLWQRYILWTFMLKQFSIWRGVKKKQLNLTVFKRQPNICLPSNWCSLFLFFNLFFGLAIRRRDKEIAFLTIVTTLLTYIRLRAYLIHIQ